MKPAITKALPRHRLAAPGLNPLALALIDKVGPLYSKIALRLSSMDFIGGEHFVEATRDFYEGRARLIIAFRHPYGEEPQFIMYAMHRALPREARRLGKPLPHGTHCNFLFGNEVPFWAGPLVRWLLPRSGSMPVNHIRLDGAGLRTIRASVREGAHPLALAPEGQTSYRSETLPRIERGALQLGFWCAEELEAARRSEKVLILPVSVHVRFGEKDLGVLESLAVGLETRLGLSHDEPAHTRAPDAASQRRAFGQRLRRIDLALLGLAESYYGLEAGSPASENFPELIAWREKRRLATLEEALRRSEAVFGLPSDGDLIARVYRVRDEGWNRIYAEAHIDGLAPLERELADRRAGEAWYAMRHMETVDLGFYLDADYLESQLADGASPSIGRLAETAYNLVDLASRLTGGNFSDRTNSLDRQVVLVAEPPLELRSRLEDYRTDRRGTLEKAEADLVGAYHHAIKEYLDGH